MADKLALLVVDISEHLEDLIKAQERGYFVQLDYSTGLWDARNDFKPADILGDMMYPYGSLRSGFDAIVDTANIASKKGKIVYASYFYDGWSDGEEQPAYSLMQCVKKKNIFEKTTYSAFKSGRLASCLEKNECKQLMILGYDRDCCVLATAEDAVKRGIKVITCEQLMLTKNKGDKRNFSLNYFKKNTVFLESLVDAWNYVQKD